MPRLSLLPLALAILAPLVAGSASEPFAPSRVMAESAGGSALVEWAPGLEAADSYRIYGFDGHAFRLLLDSADAGTPLVLAVAVPAGFAAYAVSGVQDAVESRLVFAEDVRASCIWIQTDPPGVLVECDPRRTSPVHELP